MKSLLLFILFFISTASFSQHSLANTFTLSGKIVGQDTGYIHLRYVNSLGNLIHDSCYLENGAFKFTGTVDAPTDASFYGNIKSRSVNNPNFTDIFIEPTSMQAVLKVDDFKHGKISGSKTQNEWTIYTHQSDSLDERWKTMFANLKEARRNNDTVSINLIDEKELPVYRSEKESLMKCFIQEFPYSIISAEFLIVLSDKVSLDTLRKLYTVLSPAAQQSTYGKKVSDIIMRSALVEIGRQAPAFTQPDIFNKQVSLDDFKGKFVLLEFSASWCAPCREQIPDLKKVYTALPNKQFDIISISLDRDKADWLAAIKKEEMPWTQLCDFKGNESELINKYNVSGIPANFLINPAGKIIATDLESAALEKKLTELMH